MASDDAASHPPPGEGMAAPPSDPAPDTATAPARSGPLRQSMRSLRVFAWLKRFAKLWGFALFCLFVLYFFRHIVLPFVFAVLVAYLLAPLVDRMARAPNGRRRMSRGAAVIILYVFMLSALGGAFAFVVPRLSGDFARLFREAPEHIQRFNRDYLPRLGAWIDEHFGAGEVDAPGGEALDPEHPPEERAFIEPLPGGRYRLNLEALAFEVRPGDGAGEYIVAPHRERRAADREAGGRWERSLKRWVEEKVEGTEGETRRALEYGQKFVTAIVASVWKTVLVLMLAAFILVDLERVRRFIRSLVPANYQDDYDRIARGIDLGLSGVIRGQFLIMLVNGFLTYVGLVILGVKYPLLLGAIATVMSLIPIFGSFLSSIPIVAVALVSRGGFDLSLGLYVTGWIILIHLVEANFLNPKIMGGAARTHPVLVVFALIAGEHTWGLVGALFAVPVLSIVQTVFVYLRGKGQAPAGA